MTNYSTGLYPISDEAQTDELIFAAAALVPAIRLSARESELQRRIVPEIIEQAAEAGLFKVLVPKRFGGYGLGFRALCEITRVLSHGDPATAWTIGFLIEHNWMICHLPMAGQERLFEKRSYLKASAPLVPSGTAVPVEGGYRVSGTFHYASANMNSDLSLVCAMVDEQGEKIPYLFLINLDDAVVNDDWFMSGMAATSSCSITATDLFVPTEFTIEKEIFLSPDHPGAEHEESVYRYPMMPGLTHMMTSFALGSAEEVVSMAKERLAKSRPYGHARVNRELSRERWGKAHQNIRSARLLYEDVLQTIIRKGDAEEQWSEPEMGQLQLDQLTIAHLAKNAIREIADGSGSSAFRLDDRLQRYVRDIDVISNHLGFDYDVVAEQAVRGILELGRRDYDPFPPRRTPRQLVVDES